MFLSVHNDTEIWRLKLSSEKVSATDQNHFFHEMLGLTKVVVTNVSNLDLTFDSRWNTLSPYQASVVSRMLVTMMMMMEGQDVNAQVAIRIFYIGHRTAFLQRTACMHILLSAGEGNTTGPIDWGMAFHDHLTPEMMSLLKRSSVEVLTGQMHWFFLRLYL